MRFSSQNDISSKELKAIIFDMDDTMVKTMELHFEAWVELCLKNNPKNIELDDKEGVSWLNIERVKKFYDGCTSEEFVKKLFGDLPSVIIKKYVLEKEQLFMQRSNAIKEIDGLTGFLNSCENIDKAIASSTSRIGIDYVLNKLNLNRFFDPEYIVDPSKIKNGKPHPDPYLKAAELLNVSPNNCVVFEDSYGGIKSAKTAGMRVIGISTSISHDDLLELGVSKVISDYTEIKDLQNLQNFFSMFE